MTLNEYKQRLVERKATNEYDDDLMDYIASSMLAPEAGLQLADPSLVSFYKDYNHRILWIDKDINPSLFTEIKCILQWNREDEEKHIAISKRMPITCIIDTYGGWIDSAFSFIDLVSKSKTPVRTINFGNCLSAGSILLMSGTPGYRYCMPLSTALIHEGNGGSGGTYSQVQAQSENYKHTIETMKDWVIKHSKIDAKIMKKWTGKETYLYAEDQLKYGLVDHIVEDITEIL